MKQSGRVIPFNYLKIDSSQRCCAKKSVSEEVLYCNVISELKLKGLTISGSYYSDCGHHKPVLTLLKHKSTELRSLKSESTGPLSRFTADDWSPQFSQLEKLSLEGSCYNYSSMPWTELDRIQCVFQCANNKLGPF